MWKRTSDAGTIVENVQTILDHNTGDPAVKAICGVALRVCAAHAKAADFPKTGEFIEELACKIATSERKLSTSLLEKIADEEALEPLKWLIG
jgi:hypothetical protein